MSHPAVRAVIYVDYFPVGGDVPGEAQEARCRAWAAAQGIEIVAVFSDPGSSFEGQRPGFDRMLRSVREDPVDAIIALAPDYLAVTERDRIRLGMVPARVLYPPPARTGRDWYAVPAVLMAVVVGWTIYVLAGATAGTPVSVAVVAGVVVGGLPVAGYAWARTRPRLSWRIRDRLVILLVLWAVVVEIRVIIELVTTSGPFPGWAAVVVAAAPLLALFCTLRALPTGER